MQLLSLVVLSAAAQIRPELRTWDMMDGLPQSTVTSISQRPDGLLVLATFGGVARFDGVTFKVWDGTSAGLSSIRMTATAAFANGDVWLGSQDGSVSRMREGRIVQVPSEFLGVVWQIVEHDGEAWVASDAGLFRQEGSQLVRVLEGPADRIASWPGVGLAVGGSGAVRIVDGDIVTQTVDMDVVHTLAVVDGALLVGSDNGVWRVTERGELTLESPEPVHRIAAGGGGNTWFQFGTEVWRPDSMERVTLPRGGRSLLVDQEGSLWVGLDGGGLAQVVHRPFELYARPGRVTTLPRPDGSYVSARCGRLGEGSVVREHARGASDRVLLEEPEHCVASMAWVDGALWVGLDTAVFDVTAGRPVGSPLPEEILAIGPDGDWVGTSSWAYRRDGESWRREPAIRGPVAAIVADGESLWFGAASGVHRRSHGTWTHWGPSNGLATTPVRDVWPHGAGAWAGTYGSGMHFVGPDGVTSLAQPEGLADNVVSRILDDGVGSVWLLGNQGISRVPIDDLDAFVAGRVPGVRSRLWRTGEGNGGAQPAGHRIDGHIVMPTIDGVAVFDVDHMPTNAVPPRMVLLSAGLDGEPLMPGMHPTTRRGVLEVAYTIGTLTEPTLATFRYRMDGADWVPVGSQRTLSWEGLAPGRHHLEIAGANEDSVWSVEPLVLDFDIAPAWHERWSVRLLALFGMAGIGFAAQRARVVAARQRNERLQVEIAQRQVAEAELTRREVHYRSVFEAVGDGLLLVDGDGVVREVNPAARLLFRRNDLVGVSLSDLLGAEMSPGVVTVRLEDSSFAAAVKSIPAPGGELVSVADISPLQASAQTERLEAIGRLAGGVAHDVNNLLTAMSGTGAVLREHLDALAAPGDALELVDDIDACVERGGILTRELMAFGRRQMLSPRVVSVADAVRGAAPLLRRAVREDTPLRTKIVDGDLWVRVDLPQLELALLNLVLNAVAAMPDGGRIRVLVRRGDGSAVFEVSDEGAGIPPDVLPHIYEPFFTTRLGGSGLGLPSVHGFVAQSGGRLECDTEEGVGTTFRVVLPLCDAPLVVVAEAVAPGEAPLQRPILVCDDDPLVLDALVRMVRVMGLVPLPHSDAAEAAEVDPDTLDGLITDVLMPTLRGPELAARLRARRPDLPVLYVSGYTEDIDLSASDGPLLHKPFRLETLQKELELLLARPVGR